MDMGKVNPDQPIAMLSKKTTFFLLTNKCYSSPQKDSDQANHPAQ